MNILITSGGTSEPIDSVRTITNFSTGTLGSLVADTFGQRDDIEKIFYVCNKTAVHPVSEKTEVMYITDTASVEKTICRIINENKIDIIVHAMAISDYRVKKVVYGDDETDIKTNGKISSNIEELTLYLEKTQKIISKLRSFAPHAVIIGFKLLDGVPREELIAAGYKLLVNNHCDYVLANDFKDIDNEKHIGYLIAKNGKYVMYENKKEIAIGICSVNKCS